MRARVLATLSSPTSMPVMPCSTLSVSVQMQDHIIHDELRVVLYDVKGSGPEWYISAA